MDNEDRPMTWRERRRRQHEKKRESEDNTDMVPEQKGSEHSITSGNGSRMLIRRNTFTMSGAETDSVATHGSEEMKGRSREEEDCIVLPFGASVGQSDSEDSNNLTHTINMDSLNSDSKNLTYDLVDGGSDKNNHTYSIAQAQAELDADVLRPIPAPRRRQSSARIETDKRSSDTDKDVTDIEVEEYAEKEISSNEVSANEAIRPPSESGVIVEIPKPKPRKSKSIVQYQLNKKSESLTRWKSLEQISVNILTPRSIRSNPERRSGSSRGIRSDDKSSVSNVASEKLKRTEKLVQFLQRRKLIKSSKKQPSTVRTTTTPVPTISQVLTDLKEDRPRSKREDDRVDHQLDSPRLLQSQENDKMYVQSRNGFYLRSRDDVLKHNEKLLMTSGNIGDMEESATCSMIKSAILFQKYWSRSMMCFHGILAGLGVGHAFATTAIIFYFNNEVQEFVHLYSGLALKIHFLFYMLTTLCIVSCLDRLDIGNLKRRHWEVIFNKWPSLWLIFIMYIASLALTFVNHNTESKYDSHRYENVTGDKSWDPKIYSDVPKILTSWFRIIWARDMMVSAAWLFISLSEYPDNLQSYVTDLSNGVRACKSNGEHHKISAITT